MTKHVFAFAGVVGLSMLSGCADEAPLLQTKPEDTATSLDDCNDANATNALEGVWGTYDDRSAEGTSEVWPPSTLRGGAFMMSARVPGIEFAARLMGVMGEDGGFVGMFTSLGAYALCPESLNEVDLSMFEGIRFKVKAEMKGQGTLTLRIPHLKNGSEKNCTQVPPLGDSLTEWKDYGVNFTSVVTTTWSDVEINFQRDLKSRNGVELQTVLENAKVLMFQYTTSSSEAIDLWIDDIELYRPATE